MAVENRIYVWEKGCEVGLPMAVFCFILEIAVFWPGIQVPVVGFLCTSHEWHFPGALRDRLFELAYPVYVMP